MDSRLVDGMNWRLIVATSPSLESWGHYRATLLREDEDRFIGGELHDATWMLSMRFDNPKSTSFRHLEGAIPQVNNATWPCRISELRRLESRDLLFAMTWTCSYTWCYFVHTIAVFTIIQMFDTPVSIAMLSSTMASWIMAYSWSFLANPTMILSIHGITILVQLHGSSTDHQWHPGYATDISDITKTSWYELM